MANKNIELEVYCKDERNYLEAVQPFVSVSAGLAWRPEHHLPHHTLLAGNAGVALRTGAARGPWILTLD